MKYGYEFHDWGLFSVIPLEEVREMDADYVMSHHTFSKELFVWVKATKPFFLAARKTNDGRCVWEDSYEGPFQRKHIFDTEEEAVAFGRIDSAFELKD